MSRTNKYGSTAATIAVFLFTVFQQFESVVGFPSTVSDAIKLWAMMPDWLQMLIFGASCFWLALAWSGDIFRKFKRSWPDFEKWDNVNKFRLWEAAALWVDESPRRPPGRREQRQFRRFERAINGRALDVIRPDLKEVVSDAYDKAFDGIEPKANPEWTTTREELIKFAESSSERPRFLYPKERR